LDFNLPSFRIRKISDMTAPSQTTPRMQTALSATDQVALAMRGRSLSRYGIPPAVDPLLIV